MLQSHRSIRLLRFNNQQRMSIRLVVSWTCRRILVLSADLGVQYRDSTQVVSTSFVIVVEQRSFKGEISRLPSGTTGEKIRLCDCVIVTWNLPSKIFSTFREVS